MYHMDFRVLKDNQPYNASYPSNACFFTCIEFRWNSKSSVQLINLAFDWNLQSAVRDDEAKKTFDNSSPQQNTSGMIII